MRTRRITRSVLALGAASACAVAVAAGASGRTATRAATKGAVIKTEGRSSLQPNPANPPNKEVVFKLGWSPGTISVHRGERVTLVDADHSGDPHVFVVSPVKDLPKSLSGASKNPVLRVVGPEILKDPHNPSQGFKTLKANRGKAGLNTIGDALVLTHHGATNSAIVSAKPGTTLHYFCAIHFWMQGEIKVVK